ncbi:Putative F-box and FNIP repeat-containing protein L60 [Durusdinium trenchii]|uniref:F-box and FNIP repeat-containing protein L60 n=1 Tax=Durusdinium trenchii TaxID=1381693 RepID=A0ABP0SPQ5_9DINO
MATAMVLWPFLSLKRRPRPHEVLLCHPKSSTEQMLLLLLRWCQSSEGFFCLLLPESSSFAAQQTIVQAVHDATDEGGPLPKPRCPLMLVICGAQAAQAQVATQLMAHRVELRPPLELFAQEVAPWLLASGDREELGISVHVGPHCGCGKTFSVRMTAKEADCDYATLKLTASMGIGKLSQELRTALAQRTVAPGEGTPWAPPGTRRKQLLHLDLSAGQQLLDSEAFAVALLELLVLGRLGRTAARTPQAIFELESRVRVALELPAGASADGWPRAPLLGWLPVVSCSSEAASFRADEASLRFGMGAAFASARHDGVKDGSPANAYRRLQFVCGALAVSKRLKGAFPLHFRANDLTELSGETCYQLLVETAKLQLRPSLWNLWAFVDVLYWQLKEVHHPESVANQACLPEEGAPMEKPLDEIQPEDCPIFKGTVRFAGWFSFSCIPLSGWLLPADASSSRHRRNSLEAPLPEEVLEIRVVGLDGEGFRLLGVPESLLGRHLQKMISERLPAKAGARVLVQKGAQMLSPAKSLKEQGLHRSEAEESETDSCLQVSYIYGPSNLQNAYRFIIGLPVEEEEIALEGLTLLSGMSSLNQLRELPASLRTLAFGEDFNQGLEGLHWPSNMKSLTFGKQFNQRLEGVTLPSSLQSLTFGENFNQSLTRLAFPSSLQSLTFGKAFNLSIDRVTWPPNLLHLTLGDRFDQSLQRVTLPRSLISLEFGDHFNQNLEEAILPSSLKSLKFGLGFNQNLTHVSWPSHLESLTFGSFFNQSLERMALPDSLQTLVFGSGFDQTLEEVTWPSGLRTLTLGNQFNQSLERVAWPPCLEHLSFGNQFNQSLEGVAWPKSLKTLTFGELSSFNQSLERATWPSGLQSLTFGFGFNQPLEEVHWPASLLHLKFGARFNQRLQQVTWPKALESFFVGNGFDQTLAAVAWPSSLKTLMLGHAFDQKLEHATWPPKLQSLTLGNRFNQSLEDVNWPESLETLKFAGGFNQFGSGFNKPLPHSWPPRLQSLTLGDSFDQSLEGVRWPAELRCLTFGTRFDQSLQKITWPQSLESLTFGNRFNHPLHRVVWPNSLQSLTLGNQFNQSLKRVALPSSLQRLTLGCPFDQILVGVTLPRGLKLIDHNGLVLSTLSDA